MSNNNPSSEVKTKNITLGLIISWIFSVLFGLSGITMLVKQPIPALLFILAALVMWPPLTKFLHTKKQLTLSRGLKVTIVVILLMLAGSQLQSPGASRPASQAQTQGTPASAPEVIKVNARRIVDDYKANEVSADAKYKGKLIEVSGVVDTIGKDLLDTPFISLQSYEYAIIDHVQCMFDKAAEAELAQVSKNQSITLRGEVSGKLGNIVVRGCRIVK
jgi:hypothetical protein